MSYLLRLQPVILVKFSLQHDSQILLLHTSPAEFRTSFDVKRFIISRKEKGEKQVVSLPEYIQPSI